MEAGSWFAHILEKGLQRFVSSETEDDMYCSFLD